MSERAALGLLDTSVLIDLDTIDARSLPVRSRISAVTLAELGLGLHTAGAAVRPLRAERLQRAQEKFTPLPFGVAEAQRFTHMVGLVVALGRSPRPRRQDLMIAATASVHGLPLFTRNPDDLRGLESVLQVVAV